MKGVRGLNLGATALACGQLMRENAMNLLPVYTAVLPLADMASVSAGLKAIGSLLVSMEANEERLPFTQLVRVLSALPTPLSRDEKCAGAANAPSPFHDPVEWC